MDTTEWDSKISAVESSVTELLGPMEHKAQVFMDAVAEWLAGWWEKTAKSCIAQHATKIDPQQIPEGIVREVRDRVRALIDDRAAVVRRYLEADQLWAHRANLAKVKDMDRWRYGSTYDSVTRLPKELDERVRLAMGEVGTLLVERNIGSFMTSDRDYSDVGWRRAGSHVRYPFGFDVPKQVTEALEPYRDLYEQLREKLEALDSARAGRARDVALSDWD